MIESVSLYAEAETKPAGSSAFYIQAVPGLPPFFNGGKTYSSSCNENHNSRLPFMDWADDIESVYVQKRIIEYVSLYAEAETKPAGSSASCIQVAPGLPVYRHSSRSTFGGKTTATGYNACTTAGVDVCHWCCGGAVKSCLHVEPYNVANVALTVSMHILIFSYSCALAQK